MIPLRIADCGLRIYRSLRVCPKTGLVLFLLWSTLAEAEEISVAASVDATTVGLDDFLTLTITVSGNELGSIEPVLPPLQGFSVVGQNSSSSSQISIVNGHISSSKTLNFIYTLQPQAEGTYTIQPVRISHGGKTYQTEPIRVTVVAGKAPGRPGTGRSSGRPRTSATVSPQNLKRNLFVQATPDKREIYVGEQLTLTYALYTRLQLSNVQFGQMPSYSGFWVEDLFTAQQLNFQPKRVNGIAYDAALLKRVALFPTAPGSYPITPLSMICEVVARRRRSLFDDDFFNDPFAGFFGHTRRVEITADSLQVTVLPLPRAARPADFSGAVGHFTIQGAVDADTVQAGQPFTLTVTVSGDGNIRTMGDPALPDLSDFKQYRSAQAEVKVKPGLRVSGERIYKHVLVPVAAGTYTIAPVRLTFFDPEARTYRKVATAALPIVVRPGQLLASNQPYMVAKEEVQVLGSDIRYIKPGRMAITNQGQPLYRSPLFLLLQTLPLLAVGTALLYRSHARRLKSDVEYARRHRARSRARQLLKEVRRQLRAGDGKAFYGAVSRVLYQYTADKLNTSAAGMTAPQLLDLLRARGVAEDILSDLKTCLDRCDMARFAPSMLGGEEKEQTLRTTERLIDRLEACEGL